MQLIFVKKQSDRILLRKIFILSTTNQTKLYNKSVMKKW